MSDLTQGQHAIKLENNSFIDSKTGQTILPSLMTKEQEEMFSIHQNKFLKGESLRDSIARVKSYEIADQYLTTFVNLEDTDIYYLKFIAMFKSVQQLQLIRQTALFPMIYGRAHLRDSLKRLIVNGLIWRWTYRHPVYNDDVNVYTLSGNGYRFLETIYGQEYYFHPQNFYSLPDYFHIRFWETVDIYQLCVSLPAFHGATHLYTGHRKLISSPLQVALEMAPGQIRNFVFYPTLQRDKDSYYKEVILLWNKFTNEGQELDQPVNGLPGAQNVLAFYTSTVKAAEELTQRLNLGAFSFPIVFMIGSVIGKLGVAKSFFAPLLNTSKDENGPWIKQMEFDSILAERSNYESHEES